MITDTRPPEVFEPPLVPSRWDGKLRAEMSPLDLRKREKAVGDLRDLGFERKPVPLRKFVEGRDFLDNPPLSEIQYDAVRHLEQIYLPETYKLLAAAYGDYWNPVRQINFAYFEWGKGSGKDHICRIAVARWVYLLQCLESPQEYFGMPRQDTIHVLNVAASATQAQRAFFRPLKTLAETRPCFLGAHPKEYSIMFAKGIEAVSGHSMAETMEGLNLLGGIADEISAFKTKEEVEKFSRLSGGREPAKTSESILKMIRTSARTRFPRNFKLAAISYPRFKGDAIQQLVQVAKDDNKKYKKKSRMYVSGPCATWDVNPRVTGKEDFREDYDEDPEMARAMYECKPEFSTKRFFRNDAAVHAAFSERKPIDPLTIHYFYGKDETNVSEPLPGVESAGWQVRFGYNGLYPMVGAIYALHCDLAISGDRAGVAMSHVRQWQKDQWGTYTEEEASEPRPLVKVDFVTAFDHDLKAQPFAREVQIRWFRKLVWELMMRGFVIGSVSLDQFQSTDTMQILASRGVETSRLSMDRNSDAWNTLRDVMYDGRLEGYWNARLVEEVLGLTRLPNGKVDHPATGSKDEADALAGSVVGAIECGGSEGDEPQRRDELQGVNMFSVGSLGAHEVGLEGISLSDLQFER